MTVPVFVDTNVLIYALDERDQVKQIRAQLWVTHCWTQSAGRVSIQVLNEFYVNALSKFKASITLQKARSEVRRLRSWHPAPLDEETVEGAWAIQDRYPLSHWDALILSSAQQQECGVVLSEDMAHGQRYDNLLVVNPFMVEPGQLNDFSRISA